MKLIDRIYSKEDNTQKLVFRSKDNAICEVSVVRKGDGKDIFVVPTQTSCSMGCTFCHLTGLDIPVRNLTMAEIEDLVYDSLNEVGATEDTLLVSFMGAGEPLMNTVEVLQAALSIKEWLEFDYATIRFGLATLMPGEARMRQFTALVRDYRLPMKLHWSLHHVDPAARKSLMPAALHQEQGAHLLRDYRHQTGNPIEVHYTLIDGVNDTYKHAIALVQLLGDQIPVKLLRFAPRTDSYLRESKHVDDFERALRGYGLIVEEYCPPGRDIGSSCGQFVVSRYLGR